MTGDSRAAGRALDPGQRKALDQWVGGKGMVRKIQTGQVSSETTTNFDEAMQAMPRVNGLVYRAVNPSGASAEFAANLKPGQTIELGVPVSTSIDPRKSGAFGTNLYEIETSHAAYVGGVGANYAYEKEAVLAPGRFEVVSVEQVSMGLGKHTAQVNVVRLRDVTPGGGRSFKPTTGKDFRVTEVDTPRVPVQDGGMTKTSHGPLPKVTGYAKGREIEPGMLVNAADLLPMHESQGSTTGENPNPLGHADWVRVGLVGNTNSPEFRSYNSNRSLTGGMYVVFDQAGHPVGRMSANTIAEVNTEDHQPKAALDVIRMPIKIKVTVNDGFGKSHEEVRDSFEAVHVPSAFAQQEAGMPAPKLLRDGILDPKDPNYGKNARRPAPANRPFGPKVQGTRTREEYRADRENRKAVYASGEDERARKRAEKEAQRKADAAVQRERDRIEAERITAVRREEQRRDHIQRRHDQVLRDLADNNPQIYDRNTGAVRSSTPEEFAANRLTSGSGDLRWLAATYGLKTRGTTLGEQAQGIVAAVKAGKTPDLGVGAPKVLGEAEQAAADAKKIATADKRRRNEVTKNFDTLKAAVQADETDPRFHWSGKLDSRVADHFSFHMSETQMRQLAEAFGLGALTGRALRDAIVEALKAGRQPDLDAAPITSLKKSRR